MTTKIVDTIRRTGTATSPIRQLIVVQGSGKHAVETVLSTSIEKIKGAEAFRFGGSPRPMEQYAFRVGKTVVERFADAAALVLRRHHVSLADPAADDHQEYVKRAFAILAGTEAMRVLSSEDIEGYQPAREQPKAA